MFLSKNKVIQLFIVFVNMFVIAINMESAYFIKNVFYVRIIGYALTPPLLVFMFNRLINEKELKAKIVYLGSIALLGYIIYRQALGISVGSIPGDVERINASINAGKTIEFELFQNILKLIMLLGSLILSLTYYIFPYNIIILDMGLLIFLWIIDYEKNTYQYVRLFLPVWAFSIMAYRSALLDADAKNFKVNVSARLFQVGIITLVVTLSSFFININAKGAYSDRIWNYFNQQVVQNTYLVGESIRNPFNISSSGYNDSDTLLGGAVSVNNDEVLWVFGEEAVYLRGSVRSIYIGDRWERDPIAYYSNKSIEYSRRETLNFLSGNSQAAIKSMEIEPLDEFTATIFTSSYTRDVGFIDSDAEVYYDKTYNIFTSNRTTEDNYFINYYDERTVRENLLLFPTEDGRVDAKYLDVPFGVTYRTVELVRSIVDESMSNYEKAVALTAYLKANYAYSLTPGDLPEGRDFVDYFLFDAKEGYCVYFGTALAVMLRIADVPTRYVEGFKMGTEKIGEKYVVRNSDAHAWTEVLIDEENGIWMTFDATGTPREMIFGEEPAENGNPGSETPSETPSTSTNGLPGNQTTTNGGEENGGEDEQRGSSFGRILLILMGFLAILTGIRMLYRKRKLEKAIQEKSLKPYFREVTKALAYIRYEREKGETYLELTNRIKDRELKKEFLTLVSEVYKEEYNGEVGTYEGRRELLSSIYLKVRLYRGKVFHFIRKYLL